MSRIALLGTGPLPEAGVKFFSGQCLRTWHFAKPLLEAGHEVRIYTHPIDDRAWKPGDPVRTEARFQGHKYSAFQTNREEEILRELETEWSSFRPQALFGINPFPAAILARSRFRAPLWADLNGYGPAEGQTHCVLQGNDDALEHFWRLEWSVVRRADRISTVSRRQRLATLGELAMAGRLNRLTSNHPFAQYVPNAVAERFVNFEPPPAQLRGSKIPHDAFMLLWSGGFNTWTDIPTLDAALEQLLGQHPSLHFVATGGLIAGHDERTFAEFQRRAAKSPHRDRIHLLGWVETEVVDALFGEADLGISLDSENYETVFGARNRLTTMMACGLPVVTTRGTEISEDIDAAKTGLVVGIGDVEGLVSAVGWAIGRPADLQELGRRARAWALEEFSYARTTAAALEWAARPEWAPDNRERLHAAAPGTPLDRAALNSLDGLLTVLDRATYEELLRDQRDLRMLRGKRTFKLAQKLKRLVKGGQ